MKLKYNPYQVFHGSKTPAGLYARQKWLQEAKTDQWQFDFKKTVATLITNQLPDGSWRQSTEATILHLFGLHLTLRACEPSIDTGLNWLLEKVELQTVKLDNDVQIASTGIPSTGLPFVSSHPLMFLTAATLFLASIFGRENDQAVLANYQRLSEEGLKKKGQWLDRFSTHNILRALVVHPEYSKCRATLLAVERIGNLQTQDDGNWNGSLPFYQTLNALAQLDHNSADRQLELAFKWLFKNQNSDGTWSRIEPEWNTFLAVHSLKNKGII